MAARMPSLTTVLVCFHILLQIQVSYGQAAGETTGETTTYIVALLGQRIQNETFDEQTRYELVLTNNGNNPVEVNITGIEGVIETVTVDVGDRETREFNETRSLNGSEYSCKTIYVKAADPFDLHVFSKTVDYNEGLLGIPIQKMNRSSDSSFAAYDYLVTTFCDTGGYCQLAVAALENDTFVSIDLPDHIDDIVFCIGMKTFHSKTEKRITLHQYDAIQFETTFDLTGTHIYSHKPIVVFAGSRSIESGGILAHTVEQLFPTWLWGTEYVVAPIGETSYGDIIKIAGSHYNFTVSMSGRPPILIEHRYYTISRRIEQGTAVYIHSTSPIQVMQISGLKYASNNTGETPALSMTVVPSFNNIKDPLNTAPHCSEEVQVYVAEADANTGIKIMYSPHAIEQLTSYPSYPDIKKPTILKCGSTTTLPASYEFNMNATLGETDKIIRTPIIPEQTCYDGGSSFVKFDPSASVTKPTKIDLSHPYHILKLRIQFCGEAVLQFFTDATADNLAQSLLVRISYSQMVVTKCPASDECTTDIITDDNKINSGDDLNCDDDMAFFWFWQNQTSADKPICMGFGHYVDVENNCTETITTSGKFTHVNVMGLFTDASFNWDFEHPAGCSLYEESWRCFDRKSNCSSYGTAFCSDSRYNVFANSYCSKYCGKCSADSYGRKFMVRVPVGDKVGLLVSTVNSNTGVAVIKHKNTDHTQTNVPVKAMDDYTRYYDCYDTCLPNEEIIIITDDEVSVTVMFAKVDPDVSVVDEDGKMMSYPVYPVDTFGYEYMILVNDFERDVGFWFKMCRFTSEYSDMEVIPYLILPVDREEPVDPNFWPAVKYVNFVKTSLGAPYHVAGSSKIQFSGSVWTFNIPVGVYCGSLFAGKRPTVNDDFNQMLPINSWSTKYYIPAMDPLNTTITLNAELFVISNTDNTVVNVSVGFDGTYPIYNRGVAIQIEIDVSSSYLITSTEDIAVAVRFRSDDNSSTAFHILPPVSDMHKYNIQSIPNMFMNEFWSGSINTDVRTFYGNESTSGDWINNQGNDNNFIRLKSLNQRIYGMSVISDLMTKKWIVMPTPREVITRVKMQHKCMISTDTLDDNVDGDCDLLVDEENCVDHAYGVYRQDTDLDGAFGEDCGSTRPGTPVVDPVVDPICLIIDKPDGQCWTYCQCKCSWEEKRLASANKTVEELEATLAKDNAKIQDELQVDTVALSSTTAQKQSKGDERQSAASIGYVGIAMFCIVFGAIFIMDIGSLIRDARILIANLKDGYEQLFGC